MTDAFDSMDLNTAYEIAGGYIEADDKTFEQALKMVREDDARFAQELKNAHEAQRRFAEKQEKEEAITASAEEALENASFIKAEFDDEKFKQAFFDDKEVKEAEKNTPVYDINPETQERFELEGDEKHAHFEMLFEKAKLDVWREEAGNKEFSQLAAKKKKNRLFSAVKSSFLGTLAHLRTSAQVENEVPQAAEAVKSDNKNFFARQAASMLAKVQKAISFDKEVRISSSSVMAACAESEAKTNSFAKKFAELAKKSSGKAKECYSKVSVLTHKFKESFVSKAKVVWGQRYEFMANIRDRAPKIATDLAATGVLVGATVASAPWLGTAVIAYGAYKATSAWVWPVVTHARKAQRLAKNDEKAPKMSFFKRLKQSANQVVGTKDYYKEAGWGCAAGLLGLGAAGATAGLGAGALVQKSFQSLSSTAVYTTNSITNAVKKLKEKDGNWWSKGLAVASAAVMTYVLASCGDHAEDVVRTTQANGGLPNLTNPNEPNVFTPKAANAVQEQATQVAQAAPVQISVPENWEASMGITEQQWTRLQSFWGGEAQYNHFYQKITDDMLKDGGIFAGKTREQVLFEYERLSSWNLPQHQEVIRRMDSFFGCDGDERIMLTTEDTKSLNDVMSNGSIRDVNGTECVRVTGREVNCGEEAIRHDEKIDCGCEENVIVNETVQQPTVNEPAQAASSEPTFTEVEGETRYVGVPRSEEQVVDPAVKVVKANNLKPGKIIDEADASTVAQTQADNVEVVIGKSSAEAASADAQGDASGIVITDDIEFEEIPGNTIYADDAARQAAQQVSAAGEEISFTEVPGRTIEVHSGDSVSQEAVVSTHAEGADPVASAVNGDVKETIIPNSADVEVGTPAADNVPERGGYMNTGLTEKQYHRMETFFKDQFGENAFEDYMNRITDDMRAKGGMFEGLSRAQALYSVQQMTAWSNDQHGAFAKEISTMIEYLKGECKDTVTLTESEQIKAIIDKVNANGTIDGVTGTTNKMVKYFQANDCGEAGTYNVQDVAGDSRTTQPSGNKFARFFKKIWNTSPEPVFTEVEGETRYIPVVHVQEEVVDPHVVVVKANNLQPGKVLGETSADTVSNVQADNVEVVIGEASSTPASEAAVEAAKERVAGKVSKKAAETASEVPADKLTKEAEAYVRSRGFDPKKVNPNLYKYLNEGREK